MTPAGWTREECDVLENGGGIWEDRFRPGRRRAARSARQKEG